MCFSENAASSLPDRIVCVLHSVESTSCSSLNVGDLIVKHLHTKRNQSFTTALSSWRFIKPQRLVSVPHMNAFIWSTVNLPIAKKKADKEEASFIICVCMQPDIVAYCLYVQRWTPRSHLPSLPLSSCTLLRGSFSGWQHGWQSLPSCPAWIPGRSSSRSASSVHHYRPGRSTWQRG